MVHRSLRYSAAFCHFMIFASSVIVTGVVSYFFSRYTFRGSHIVYQEVIAVLTIPTYLIAMVSPFFSSYEGYFLPVNFIFSYLWLTSFIFSATDWSGNLCRETPLGTSKCSLKRTVESFNFIAFFFLICNVIIEAFLMRACRKSHRQNNIVAKERRSTPGNRYSDATATQVTPDRNGATETAQL